MTDKPVKKWIAVRTRGLRIDASAPPILFDRTVLTCGETHLIVVSEIRNHAGPSVTNAIEAIRAHTLAALKLAKEPTWFEHYPKNCGLLKGSYTLTRVSFEQGAPEWSNLLTWEQIAKHFEIDAAMLAEGYEDELAA